MPETPAHNCLLSVQGYGAVTSNAVRIEHGVKILASTTSGRNHRSMLPWKQTSGSCKIRFKHTSREDYANFNEWLKVYAETISSPDGRLGTMRIYCPAAKFDRMCLPHTGIRFGITHGEFVWTQDIAFVGASDPIDTTDVGAAISYGAGVTRYVGNSDEQLSNFSIALGGIANLNNPGASLEDSLYNSRLSPIPGM